MKPRKWKLLKQANISDRQWKAAKKAMPTLDPACAAARKHKRRE